MYVRREKNKMFAVWLLSLTVWGPIQIVIHTLKYKPKIIELY